jgi:hypothetical protein
MAICMIPLYAAKIAMLIIGLAGWALAVGLVVAAILIPTRIVADWIELRFWALWVLIVYGTAKQQRRKRDRLTRTKQQETLP